LAGIFGHAFVPVELFLKARLRIRSPPECTPGNFDSRLRTVQTRLPERCSAIGRP
jgi:hypothetical protein